MKAKIIMLIALLVLTLWQEQSNKKDTPQKVIKVSVEVLRTFEGDYAVDQSRMIKVHLDEGTLYLHVPGQTRKVKLLAKSEIDFFNEINAAQIRFNRNQKGRVLSLTITNEAGRHITALKN